MTLKTKALVMSIIVLNLPLSGLVALQSSAVALADDTPVPVGLKEVSSFFIALACLAAVEGIATAG